VSAPLTVLVDAAPLSGAALLLRVLLLGFGVAVVACLLPRSAAGVHRLRSQRAAALPLAPPPPVHRCLSLFSGCWSPNIRRTCSCPPAVALPRPVPWYTVRHSAPTVYTRGMWYWRCIPSSASACASCWAGVTTRGPCERICRSGVRAPGRIWTALLVCSGVPSCGCAGRAVLGGHFRMYVPTIASLFFIFSVARLAFSGLNLTSCSSMRYFVMARQISRVSTMHDITGGHHARYHG
jgi:hypothetical protein